jgi:hypothetical protein
MAASSLKPQTMRGILSFILVAAVLGGAALFYLGLTTVQTYSEDVNKRLIDATASETQVRQLQTLRQKIADNEALIAKADKVFATPSNYQAEALNDVRAYANQAGVSIRSTDFDDPSSGTYSITVRLNNPVNYTSLVRFITLIEGNLPVLQLTSLDISRPQTNAGTNVTVGDIKINIAVR